MKKFTISYGYKYFSDDVYMGAIIIESESFSLAQNIAMKAVLLEITKHNGDPDFTNMSNLSITVLEGDQTQQGSSFKIN
jgi:hypothetical protein